MGAPAVQPSAMYQLINRNAMLDVLCCADGPARRAASRSVHGLSRCTQSWAMSDGRLLTALGTSTVAKCYQRRTDDRRLFIALGDGGPDAVTKFSECRVWDKDTKREVYPYFV